MATMGIADPGEIKENPFGKSVLIGLTPTQDEKETSIVQSITEHSNQHHVKQYSFTQHPTESRYK